MPLKPRRSRESFRNGVDKSVLAIGMASKGTGRIDRTHPSLVIRENPRIVDPAFRASARGRVCDTLGCGRCDDSVVGAHIRVTLPGLPGAAGAKPSDDLMLFLCFDCHQKLDRRVPISQEEYAEFLLSVIAGFTTLRARAWRRANPPKSCRLPLLRGNKLPGFCR